MAEPCIACGCSLRSGAHFCASCGTRAAGTSVQERARPWWVYTCTGLLGVVLALSGVIWVAVSDDRLTVDSQQVSPQDEQVSPDTSVLPRIEGTMKLPRSRVSVDETGCQGLEDYGDIRAGSEVLLLDEAGAVLVTDSLSAGVANETDCVFEFTLENVPVAGSYQVRIGRWAGPLNSYEDTALRDWTIDLFLR